MSEVPPHQPDYAEGAPIGRRRQRRRTWLVALALLLLAGVIGVRRGMVIRARLLYWQSRCARWDGPVVISADQQPVPWPRCFRGLWSALGDAHCSLGPSFFDDQQSPIIFLHDRTSLAGVHRLVAMEFRPNIDHGQMCSLDCVVIDPATLTVPPTGTARVVAWVSGFWSNLQFDQLRPAVADPDDPSHFVFSYSEWVAAHETDFSAACQFDATTRPANERRLVTRTVDGWLLDDGTVRVEERSTVPPDSPPPSRVSDVRPRLLRRPGETLGPPRP